MRKHTSEDHYVCDECGKSYKFLAPFLHHKIVHENKFDYNCSYCNKAFRKMRDKLVHERTHSGGNYDSNLFVYIHDFVCFWTLNNKHIL